MHSNTFVPVYRDRFFRIIAAVLGGFFAAEHGADTSFLSRMLYSWFWIEFGVSAVIALVIVEIVAIVTRKLDVPFGWVDKPLPRSGLQFLLGVVLPAVVTFLLAAAYFSFYGLNIVKDTLYLYYALPFVISLIAIFNIYYLTYYFILYAERLKSQTAHAETGSGSEDAKEIFVVDHKGQSLSVPVEKIAFFYREGGVNFLKTFSGDAHILDFSLEEVEQKVDARKFYRVNRQVIVNYQTIKGYASLPFNKLELKLEPEMKFQTVVSQRNSPGFKDWLNR